MKHIVPFLLSVVAVIGGLGLASFLGYRSYQESKQHERIAEEIRSLQEEADRIDQDNKRLSDRIEYLQSDNFREGEAKRTLDYQMPDEKVVVIDDPALSVIGSSNSSEKGVESNALSQSSANQPNYRKWWSIFFGSESDENTGK